MPVSYTPPWTPCAISALPLRVLRALRSKYHIPSMLTPLLRSHQAIPPPNKRSLWHATRSLHPNQAPDPGNQGPLRFDQAILRFNWGVLRLNQALFRFDQATLPFNPALPPIDEACSRPSPVPTLPPRWASLWSSPPGNCPISTGRTPGYNPLGPVEGQARERQRVTAPTRKLDRTFHPLPSSFQRMRLEAAG